MTKELEFPPGAGFRAYLAESDLYRQVEKGTEEKFGKDSRAYKTIMNGIDAENATGSQFFFNTQMNLYLPKGQRVALYDDLGRISDAKADFFKGFYTDTPELVLRTDTTSRKQNKQILENLVEQVRQKDLKFSPQFPLLISGLELVRDDDLANPYGLTLAFTDRTKAVNDERFAHGKNEISFGLSKKPLWTREDGLSGVYFGGSRDVDSDYDDLSSSNDIGRVVVFDAEGVAA